MDYKDPGTDVLDLVDGEEKAAMVQAALSLRQLGSELIKSPTATNITAITSQVKVMDANVALQMQHLVIFPLRTVLAGCPKQIVPQQLLIETCQAVEVLVGKAPLRELPLFMDLFTLTSECLLCNSAGNKLKRPLSDEEKTAAVKLLSSLLRTSNAEVIHGLYTPVNIAQLGSVVSVLVGMLSNTAASRGLRVLSMDTLLMLLQQRTYDKKNWWQHGSRFAGLLPGISTATFKVLLGDSKQGHQILCNALDVWTSAVCLTLGDDLLHEEQQQGSAWFDSLEMGSSLKELLVRRDGAWVKSVQQKVELMVKEMSRLKTHGHWRVRLALCRWAQGILTQCNKSLSSCRSAVLDVLILLMSDAYPQVAAPARQALEDYRDGQGESGEEGGRALLQLLKENLYTLVTSLPRRIQMEDEEDKLAVVSLLNGYISLLGCQLSVMLLSLPHVSRLVRVLVQVLEMDVTDQKILEETGLGAKGVTNISNFLSRVNVMMPRKVFVHFRDDGVKTGLLKTCQLLGQFGDVGILVDCLLDSFRQSRVNQPACVLIISQILTGRSHRGDVSEDVEGVVRLLLEEYLSNDNMTLTGGTSASSSQSPPLVPSSPVSLYVMGDLDCSRDLQHATRNRAIMLTCLFLEGVGVCAQVLGGHFQPLLMDALYPVLEKVGSQISAVSSSAYLALCHMSEACRYTSLDELIQANADYLVNSISLRLRHFHRHRRAPSVLSVMLQLCSTNILPLVWDSIVEIVDTLDEHHAVEADTFLPVLYQLTLAVARWFPPSQGKEATATTESVSPGREKCDLSNVVSYLVDRHRLRMEAEDLDPEPPQSDDGDIQREAAEAVGSEGKGQGGEGSAEEEDAERKEAPLHVKAVKEVLQRAQHILSSSDPRLALLSLDVMAQGCLDLSQHQNDLLPAVHQLWPALKRKLQDGEKVVRIKAVKTLHTLCGCCGDFIRQRVEKDVLPGLRQFLQKQATISRGCGHSYVFTANFKLQLTLLNTLGDMALQMGLDRGALEQVVHACLPYLSRRQPSTLQQACLESMQKLISCDADIVWLALAGLYLPATPTPPSAWFKPVTVFKVSDEDNDYATNVSSLLQSLTYSWDLVG